MQASVWTALAAAGLVWQAGCAPDPYAGVYGPGPWAVPSAGYVGAGYAPYVAGPVIVPGVVGVYEYDRARWRGPDRPPPGGWYRGRPGPGWHGGPGAAPPPGWRGDRPGDWHGGPPGGWHGGPPAGGTPGGGWHGGPGGPGPRPPSTGGVQAPPGTHLVPVPGGPPGGFVIPNGRDVHSPGFPPR